MRKIWVFLLLAFLVRVACYPQKPETKFKLVSVKATGSNVFSEAEIVAASGLHVNTQVNQQGLLDATNRLIATGVFEDVVYQFAPDAAGNMAVTFQATDNKQTMPVFFENFVWFSRDQLNARLHEHVPLYRERVPLAGGIHDQIKDALQDLLNANGIKGQVSFRLRQGLIDSPINGVVYKVEGITVRVADLAFDGASPANLPALRDAGKSLLTNSYEEAIVHDFCPNNFRPLYLAKGYLKLQCGEPRLQIASQNDQQVSLNLTLPLEEGAQYKFTGATWTGNSAFSSGDLQKFILLKNGEMANAVKLEQGLGEMKSSYQAHGYLKLSYKLQAHLQEDNTASFEIQLQEGDLYRMGEFQVRGLDADRAAKLQKSWKLASGAAFDLSYMQQFIKEIPRFLPEHSRVRARPNINEQNKTVDLLIELSPPA
jgi:outer membrane protein assembly factor BamA